MIKNVLIFILLQIYLRGKNMISERGGGKNMIFNVIYGIQDVQKFVTDPDPGRTLNTDRIQAKTIRIRIQQKRIK